MFLLNETGSFRCYGYVPALYYISLPEIIESASSVVDFIPTQFCCHFVYVELSHRLYVYGWVNHLTRLLAGITELLIIWKGRLAYF